MKYAIFQKLPKELINDSDAVVAMIRSQVNQHKKRLAQKGMIFINKEVEFFEQDGDNARRNLITVRTLGDAFKVPRMVKPLYKNTFRKPTKIKISNRKSLKLYS